MSPILAVSCGATDLGLGHIASSPEQVTHSLGRSNSRARRARAGRRRPAGRQVIDHLPLARARSQIYHRLGVELSRNTLVDWVSGAAQFLRLLAYLFYRQVLGSHVVQTDDTKLPAQDRR